MNRRKMCYIVMVPEGEQAMREAALPHWGVPPVFWKHIVETETAEDPLVLSTGPLCGTGGPGTGLMSWILPDGEIHYAESKAGPYLRLAGVDGLVIGGRTTKPSLLVIEDGKGEFAEMPDSLSDLENRYRTENTVFLLAEEEGVREDRGLLAGDEQISRLLQSKGIFGLVITGSGSIPIADGAALLKEWEGLYRALAFGEEELCIKDSKMGAEPIPFLAVGATEEEIRTPRRLPKGETALAAALGIWLREPGDTGKGAVSNRLTALLSAVTGEKKKEITAGLKEVCFLLPEGEEARSNE